MNTSARWPGRTFSDKIASLLQRSGHNGIFLFSMYFHFKSVRISFISKVIRVHKATTVVNDTSLCSIILVVFLEFIPVDLAEISHINTLQKSSR